MWLPKDTEVHQCPNCDALFLSEEKLKEHMVVCNELKNKCPYCDGKGYTIDEDDYDYRHRRICAMCIGTGKK